MRVILPSPAVSASVTPGGMPVDGTGVLLDVRGAAYSDEYRHTGDWTAPVTMLRVAMPSASPPTPAEPVPPFAVSMKAYLVRPTGPIATPRPTPCSIDVRVAGVVRSQSTVGAAGFVMSSAMTAGASA